MFGLTEPALLWLALAVVLLIIEGLTVNLVSIWFAIGAGAAMLVCVLDGGILYQLLAFVLVSAVALVLTRPLAKNARNAPSTPTNADRNIGRVAKVLEPISPDHPGRVRLDGIDWAARSTSSLPADSLCRVTAMESTVLVVEPEQEPAVSRG